MDEPVQRTVGQALAPNSPLFANGHRHFMIYNSFIYHAGFQIGPFELHGIMEVFLPVEELFRKEANALDSGHG